MKTKRMSLEDINEPVPSKIYEYLMMSYLSLGFLLAWVSIILGCELSRYHINMSIVLFLSGMIYMLYCLLMMFYFIFNLMDRAIMYQGSKNCIVIFSISYEILMTLMGLCIIYRVTYVDLQIDAYNAYMIMYHLVCGLLLCIGLRVHNQQKIE